MRCRHATVLLPLLLCACASFKDKDGITEEAILASILGAEISGPGPGDASDETSSYLVEVQTTKKADGTAFGFLRANRRLYAPFEVVVVAGLVPGEDQAGFTGNAQVCVELDERASITEDLDTLLWVLVCARREGTGLSVRAQDQFTTLGSVLLPDTDAAILSIRHDGTDLIFETGPATLLGTEAAEGGLQQIARLRSEERRVGKG